MSVRRWAGSHARLGRLAGVVEHSSCEGRCGSRVAPFKHVTGSSPGRSRPGCEVLCRLRVRFGGGRPNSRADLLPPDLIRSPQKTCS